MSTARKPPGRDATIIDVARIAGVSKSTVSNVIRGSLGVTPQTKARVLEAVSKLSYRPNVLARHLVLQRTTTLGVVVGDLGNPFNAEMASHIAYEAARQGYRPMFCNTQGVAKAELDGLEGFVEHRAAGIVFLSQPVESAAAKRAVGRVPAVSVSCVCDWCDSVSADDRAGAKAATQHLIDLGHKRIAYVADPLVEDVADREREAGYRATLEAAGLRPAVFHWGGPPDQLTANARDRQVASIVADRITAIVSSNDYGAIEVLDSADRLGVKVPAELSVIGFDDVVTAGLARINLSTMRQPQPELAAAALKLLNERISGRAPRRLEHRTLPVTLVVRGSTGVAKTAR
ncbi:LacI family transcriptional regulator [bacterium]|nr:MAG: LacI family transcriptional regulator [bacterium]